MLEVYTWEPTADSFKPLFCLAEKQAPSTFHCIGLRARAYFSREFHLDEISPDPPMEGAEPGARYQAHKWGACVETHIAPNLAVQRWAEAFTLADIAVYPHAARSRRRWKAGSHGCAGGRLSPGTHRTSAIC